MAYCEICASRACNGYHPQGGSICDVCGEQSPLHDGELCYACWRYRHETNEQKYFGGSGGQPRCDKCGGQIGRPFAHFYSCS